MYYLHLGIRQLGRMDLAGSVQLQRNNICTNIGYHFQRYQQLVDSSLQHIAETGN